MTIDIYSTDGRLVRKLVNGPVPAGYHTIIFNTRTGNRDPVSRGLYLCRMEAEGYHVTLPIALIK